MADDWLLGLGAVLYNDRPDRPEDRRDLWHVSNRFEAVDSTARLYSLWDGTHTRQRYVYEADILADYVPAGWQWPLGRKPLYHLTRHCGADDPADVMTDGGQYSKHLLVARDLVGEALSHVEADSTEWSLATAEYAIECVIDGDGHLRPKDYQEAGVDSLKDAMQTADRPTVAIEAQVAKSHLTRAAFGDVPRGYDSRLRVEGGGSA